MGEAGEFDGEGGVGEGGVGGGGVGEGGAAHAPSDGDAGGGSPEGPPGD